MDPNAFSLKINIQGLEANIFIVRRPALEAIVNTHLVNLCRWLSADVSMHDCRLFLRGVDWRKVLFFGQRDGIKGACAVERKIKYFREIRIRNTSKRFLSLLFKAHTHGGKISFCSLRKNYYIYYYTMLWAI